MPKVKNDSKSGKGQRSLQIAPAERVISYTVDGGKAIIECDWIGLGSPKIMQLKIGDKVEDVKLPDRFPEVGLDYRDIIKVYDIEQKVAIESAPTRSPYNVQFMMPIDSIETTISLSAGAVPLISMSLIDTKTTVRDKEGKWLYDHVEHSLTDFERSVIDCKPCTRFCLHISIFQAEDQFPWELESIRLEPNYIIYTFKRLVHESWGLYHCDEKWRFVEGGRYNRTDREERRVRTE